MWKGHHLTDLYQCSETVQTFDVPLRLMTPSLSIIGTHRCRMTLLQYETQQQSNYRNVRIFSFPPQQRTLYHLLVTSPLSNGAGFPSGKASLK